jgi:hypothetical protein
MGTRSGYATYRIDGERMGEYALWHSTVVSNNGAQPLFR